MTTSRKENEMQFEMIDSVTQQSESTPEPDERQRDNSNDRSVPFINHYMTSSPPPRHERHPSYGLEQVDSLLSGISLPMSQCSSEDFDVFEDFIAESRNPTIPTIPTDFIPTDFILSPAESSVPSAPCEIMMRINNALINTELDDTMMITNNNNTQQISPRSATSEMSDATELEFNENRHFAMAAGLRFSRTRGENVITQTTPETSQCPDSDGDSITAPPSSHNPLSHNDSFIRKLPVKDESKNIIDSEDASKLRALASKIAPEWRGEFMAPDLARRLRDFQFAQEKRRQKYGSERPWGILGLYDHLAAVRIDIDWAEEVARRRALNQPYLSWSTYNDKLSSGFNQPFFTYILLIACTAMLITSIGVNGWDIEPLSINPMIGPSAATLIQLGAKDTDRIVNYHEVWRLVTPMFLHAGVIHYCLNMMALFLIGSAVEKCHGFFAALILFVIPAIGGTLLSAIFLPTYISVGASGGIFGLIGACLADIVMNWNLLFSDFLNEGGKKHRHTMIIFMLFLDIVVNCLIGMTPFVDNFTHLGGMVFGFLCGLSTLERLSSDFFGLELSLCSRIRQVVIRCLGLLVSLFCIGGLTFLLMNGDGRTTPCKSCRYLSCIPFPPWGNDDEKWWYCDDCGTISANARYNAATREYDELMMWCPDGKKVSVDLVGSHVTDQIWIEDHLEDLCRSNCEGKYYN